MDIALKQRIVGAFIILGIAIVFIPSVLDGPVIDSQQLALDVPPRPELIPYQVDSTRYEQLVADVKEQIPIDQAQSLSPEIATTDEPADTIDPKPRAPKASLTPIWTVQLGSFTQIGNAKDLEAKLQKNQLRAYMKKINTENGIRYKVYVGPEIRQADANQVAQQLKQKFGLSGLVVRYQIDQ